MSSNIPEGRRPKAQRLFGRYVQLVEEGKQVSFEDLCDDHPELEQELTRLKAEYDKRRVLEPSESLDESLNYALLLPRGWREQALRQLVQTQHRVDIVGFLIDDG